MDDRLGLETLDIRQFGDDLRLTFRVGERKED
jgi:hypothetical protein